MCDSYTLDLRESRLRSELSVSSHHVDLDTEGRDQRLFVRNFQQVLAADPGLGREPTALISVSLPPNRFTAAEAKRVAVLALILSVVGLYGVVSYAIASRTHEVGVRIALGASATTIIRLLTSSGIRLVLVSSAIGLTVSFLVTRLLSGLLFGIDSSDRVTSISAPLVLLAVAVLATYIFARRASRSEPISALRAD